MIEELFEVVGREGHRLTITGTIVDEAGVGIDGGTLTTNKVTMYDVKTGTVVTGVNHQTGLLTVSSGGAFTLSILSTWMTIVNANLAAGQHERKRILFELSTGAGFAFNLEFDVLVRKVRNLA